MTVRAKFRCRSVADVPDSSKPGLKTVYLDAVYDPDPNSENGKFFGYTPSGTLMIGCVNPEANAEFEVGAEYYLDITKVTAVEP